MTGFLVGLFQLLHHVLIWVNAWFWGSGRAAYDWDGLDRGLIRILTSLFAGVGSLLLHAVSSVFRIFPLVNHFGVRFR